MDFIPYIPNAATKTAAPIPSKPSKPSIPKRKMVYTAAARAASEEDDAGLAVLERGGTLKISTGRASAEKSIATTSQPAHIEQRDTITSGKDRGKPSLFSSQQNSGVNTL
jgi:hypothetical protein